LIGLVVGAAAGWLGLAATPIVLALTAWSLATHDGRRRVHGALAGFGAGLAALVFNAGVACPAVLGSPTPSCSGPDLRPALVLAACSVLAGVGLTIRRRLP